MKFQNKTLGELQKEYIILFHTAMLLLSFLKEEYVEAEWSMK